jgi:hypothetical protein
MYDWTVSLQVESFIKKENLENVHLEVQLWILKKMSSIKFICIEAYQKSGTPLVQFVAEGNNPRDIYAKWRKTSRCLRGMVRSLCLAHTTGFFAVICGHGQKTNLNFTCTK